MAHRYYLNKSGSGGLLYAYMACMHLFINHQKRKKLSIKRQMRSYLLWWSSMYVFTVPKSRKKPRKIFPIYPVGHNCKFAQSHPPRTPCSPSAQIKDNLVVSRLFPPLVHINIISRPQSLLTLSNESLQFCIQSVQPRVCTLFRDKSLGSQVSSFIV